MIRILLCFLFVASFHIANAQITMAEKADWKPIGKLKTLGSIKASLEYSYRAGIRFTCSITCW